MSGSHEPQSAAEYGRQTGCFQNHQGPRFSLQRQLVSLQGTAFATSANGLVEQSGLRTCSIPQPIIEVDDAVEEHDELVDILCNHPKSPPKSLEIIPGLAAMNELRVPVDELDLGSSPDLDLVEFLDEVFLKQCWSPSTTWLPISRVDNERDEGLNFPHKCRKLHLLINRALERESIGTSKNIEAWLDDDESTGQASVDPPAYLASLGISRARAEAVTPPVSPISEACSLFVLSAEAAVIDLTSEPSSPPLARVDQLQKNVLRGQIDSDIEAPSSTVASSPTKSHEVLPNNHRVMQDARIDVPLACLSSDPAHLPSIFDKTDPRQETLDTQELSCTLDNDQGPLEEAILQIIGASSSQAANLVGQEKLDPADSMSRMAVPIMDFHLPTPEWAQKIQSAREQFIWLQNSSKPAFAPLYPKDALLDSSLRWTPVPRGKGFVSTSEDLDMSQFEEELLVIESATHFSTGVRSACGSRPLNVLAIAVDEELELVSAVDDLLANSSTSSSRYFKPRNSSPRMNQSLGNLCRAIRRKAEDDHDSVLPLSKDTDATSKLLDDFMGLRALKKPRLSSSNISQMVQSSAPAQRLPNTAKQVPPICEAPKQVPAPSPSFEIPRHCGPCIVSLALDRQIIRQLANSWPAHLLLDNDYEQSSTVERVPEENMLLPATLDCPLTVEADITLSSNTGVMVSTLLKVKQRPLPGSKTEAPIRQRVRSLSSKYENLIVLVSENNAAGEFVTVQQPSDKTAYKEFVDFAASLNAQVTTHLVPGNKKTLGNWILSLMCRYSQNSAVMEGFIDLKETTWEQFLRRAGFNIMAARLIANALLHEFGDQGLVQFLTMSTRDRLARYGQLLGGHRILSSFCKALHREEI